jgi:hypothetical protein
MNKKEPLLVEMLKYIRRPSIEVRERPKWFIILFNVIRLWGLSFFLSIFVAVIAQIFLSRSGYTGEEFALTEFIDDYPILLVLFSVAIWAPITEELGFRLGLRFSPIRWGIGGSFLIFFLLAFVNLPFLPTGFLSFNSWGGFLNIFLLLSFLFIFIFLFLKIVPIQNFVKKFYTKFFPAIFYILTISFAILHFTNYDVNFKEIWYFAPLLIVPQFFLSFLISFVRMRYGFFWGVFTHFLNNTMAIIPVLLLASVVSMDVIHLNMEEMVFLLLGLFFLAGIFLICILSIISLLLDFTKVRE